MNNSAQRSHLLIHAVPNLCELLHHGLRGVPQEDVEVQHSTDGPVGDRRSRLDGHLWTGSSHSRERKKSLAIYHQLAKTTTN